MQNRVQYIYNFLSETDRQNLRNDLNLFIDREHHYNINSAGEMIEALSKLREITEPLVVQIIAHGNCDGFGISQQEFVKYSEISELLREINSATGNELILNLMTICCSVHQLNYFNNGPNRIFRNLIGSIKGAAVHGAIQHSIEINNLDFADVRNKIDELNYDLDDEYSIDKLETHTYLVL